MCKNTSGIDAPTGREPDSNRPERLPGRRGKPPVKYKKAESQGAYIDRLRTKYPFHIFARGYDAYLCGVQPLLEGQEEPIYRFPGGQSLVSTEELEHVVEW